MNGKYRWTLFCCDLTITDIIIHAKVLSVKVMSVIIMPNQECNIDELWNVKDRDAWTVPGNRHIPQAHTIDTYTVVCVRCWNLRIHVTIISVHQNAINGIYVIDHYILISTYIANCQRAGSTWEKHLISNLRCQLTVEGLKWKGRWKWSQDSDSWIWGNVMSIVWSLLQMIG